MARPTEEQFLKDVSKHQMEVLKDDGLYRHLRFTHNKSSVLQFDIVTWPGFLAYSGDMGCFVFSRIKDMFEFFRRRPRLGDKEVLPINPCYWEEKLQAVDCDGYTPGAKEYSPELFQSKVAEEFEDWAIEQELTDDQKEEFRQMLASEVLGVADDGEYAARRALSDFSETIDGTKLEFYDTWEWNFREYTFRYLWCCYALVWAIQQYDKYCDEQAGAAVTVGEAV